ncbi:MAG: hypothetical protein L6R36_003966 [Xanthoria steineri]|nr:MAG: hypothetical protein L6R36_008657 [Xanthoria steineri]KAI4225341.1 MAG: hypothetical protein L6R36_003966 [Xanthoria steineri]
MLQLAQNTTEPPPHSSQPGSLSTPQSSPRRLSISSNVKIIVAVCVPLFFITSTLAAYWLFRRQKTNLDRIPKTDVPGAPVYIQDLGIDHLHKWNAITIHELEMSPETEVPGSRRRTILKYTKPLPNIPVELKGSSVCKELEGNWEGPWM